MASSIKTGICIPKQGFITVKADPIEKVTKSEGGIDLPDTAQAVVVKRKGTVIAVGPEVPEDRCKPGERILFGAYAGTTIEIGGEEIEIMLSSAVMAGID